MSDSQNSLFMAVVSTYFVAKLISLVIEQHRKQKAMDKFNNVMYELDKYAKPKKKGK